jgi:hypothetical protein
MMHQRRWEVSTLAHQKPTGRRGRMSAEPVSEVDGISCVKKVAPKDYTTVAIFL